MNVFEEVIGCNYLWAELSNWARRRRRVFTDAEYGADTTDANAIKRAVRERDNFADASTWFERN